MIQSRIIFSRQVHDENIGCAEVFLTLPRQNSDAVFALIGSRRGSRVHFGTTVGTIEFERVPSGLTSPRSSPIQPISVPENKPLTQYRAQLNNLLQARGHNDRLTWEQPIKTGPEHRPSWIVKASCQSPNHLVYSLLTSAGSGRYPVRSRHRGDQKIRPGRSRSPSPEATPL